MGRGLGQGPVSEFGPVEGVRLRGPSAKGVAHFICCGYGGREATGGNHQRPKEEMACQSPTAKLHNGDLEVSGIC